MNTKVIIPVVVGVLLLIIVVVAVLILSQKHHATRAPGFTLTTHVTPDAWPSLGAGAAPDAKGRLIIWGSMWREQNPGDLLLFTPSTSSFDPLKIAGTPPAGLMIPALAVDTTRNTLYVFGGWPAGSHPSDELFKVDLSSAQPSWSRLPKTDPWPKGRNGAIFLFDTARHRLILATGDSDLDARGMFHPLGDLWQFDIITQRWSAMQQNNQAPSARWHAMAAVDNNAHKIYFIGGAGVSPPNDRALYILDLLTDSWRRLPLGEPWPPSLQGATLTFDSANNALLLAGGLRHQPPGPATSSDIWVFDVQSETWQRFSGPGAAARRDHVALYDPATATHFLIGGQISQTIGNFYEHGQPVTDLVAFQLRKPAGPANQ